MTINTNNRNSSRKEKKTIVILQYVTNLVSEWDNSRSSSSSSITASIPLLSTLQLYQLGCIFEYLSNTTKTATTTTTTSKQIDRTSTNHKDTTTTSSQQQPQPQLTTIYHQCCIYYDKYLQQQQQQYHSSINDSDDGDRSIRDMFNHYIDSLMELLLTFQQQQPSTSFTMTTTTITLEDIHMSLTSLIQLYNHSNIAYQTCFCHSNTSSSTDTWTLERLMKLIHFIDSLHKNVNSNSNNSNNNNNNSSSRKNHNDNATTLTNEIQNAIYTIVAYCLNIVPPPPPPQLHSTRSTTTTNVFWNRNEMIVSILQLLQNENMDDTTATTTRNTPPLIHTNDVWNSFVSYMNQYVPTWKEQILLQHSSISRKTDANDENNDDETREQYYQEYIQSILSTTTTSSSPSTIITSLPKIRHLQPKSMQQQQHQSQLPKRKVVSPEDEIISRIQQVKSILPQYGDGFIELALSCFNGNVETTIATLLTNSNSQSSTDPPPNNNNDHWPMVLRNVDITLPRRHMKDSKEQQQLEERQAKEITKASIQAAQQQAELEARLLEYVIPNDNEYNNNDNDDGNLSTGNRNFVTDNEYDDDYDDQYDYDVHNFVNVSKEVDPEDAVMEYEAVLTYNRTMKQMESDQEYWNSNRNTNRINNNNSNSNNTSGAVPMKDGDHKQNNNTDSKQYRGPDLLRGGRIPNPNTTGDGGRGRGRGPTGRGRGGAGTSTSNGPQSPNQSSTSTGGSTLTSNTNAPPPVSNLRHKARVLDKRRDQQKKAQMKRTGA